jgi:hypothetical protein
VHSFFVYSLITNDYEDSLERLNFLRSIHGVDPFAQPFRDFTSTYNPPQWQKDMARWANIKSIFKSIPYEEYDKKITNRYLAVNKTGILFKKEIK